MLFFGLMLHPPPIYQVRSVAAFGLPALL